MFFAEMPRFDADYLAWFGSVCSLHYSFCYVLDSMVNVVSHFFFTKVHPYSYCNLLVYNAKPESQMILLVDF